MVMLYAIILIKLFSPRSFTYTCSVSKSKKFKIDLLISKIRLVVMLTTIGQHILFLQDTKKNLAKKRLLPKVL